MYYIVIQGGYSMNTLTNKLKSLLSLKGLSFSSWAKHMNVTPQALNTKKLSNKYNMYDLTRLADLTSTKLVFIDENNNVLLEITTSDAMPTKQKSNE